MDRISTLNSERQRISEASTGIRSTVNAILDDASFVETGAFASGNAFDVATAGEGVVTGFGTVQGFPVYLIAQNSEVLGGSLGKVHAEKILKVIDMAKKAGAPLISIVDSKGARLSEGVTVLESYAKVLSAVANITEIPHICVLKGVACGLMANYVSLCDFVIASDDCVMSAGMPMTVMSKASILSKPSEALGGKFHSEKSGFADFTYKNNDELCATVSKLICLLPLSTDSYAECANDDDLNRISANLNEKACPACLIKAIADDEQYLEVGAGFASEVTCALATVNGVTTAIVATNAKGGKLSVNGVYKIAKFIAKADYLNMPLLTLVNSDIIDTDMRQETYALSMTSGLIAQIASFEGPKVAVIYGNSVGFSYSVLSSKGIGFDYVLAFANASVAPILPETAPNILYLDELLGAGDVEAKRTELVAKYEEYMADPMLAAHEGYIDDVIEPAHVRPYVVNAFQMLR